MRTGLTALIAFGMFGAAFGGTAQAAHADRSGYLIDVRHHHDDDADNDSPRRACIKYVADYRNISWRDVTVVRTKFERWYTGVAVTFPGGGAICKIDGRNNVSNVRWKTNRDWRGDW